MPQFVFKDGLFDNPGGNWVRFYKDGSFAQRYLPDAKHIFCETVFTARGSVEEAVRLLRGPWNWWQHGRASGFQTNPDGSASQVLAPVWWHITRVGVRIYSAQGLEGMGGVRLPMGVSRDFRGVASIDIYPNPAAGGITVRERYQGVESHVPAFIPISLATRIHLRAEAGTLIFPFPKGTGFPGLCQALEVAR